LLLHIDNLQANNEDEFLNTRAGKSARKSTKATAPSSKVADSTATSSTVGSNDSKETDHKLDVSHSAAAHAKTSAKGDVNLNEDQEVSTWKSPNLKYRQPLKPVTPDTVIFYLQRKALKYIVVSCLFCYLFGKLGLGWICGILSVAGGNINSFE
jgi:hypothetical protein